MIGIEIMIAQIAAAAYFGYKQCKLSERRHWSPFDLFLTLAPRHQPKPLQKSRKPRLPRRSSRRNHRRSHLMPFWKIASPRPSSTNLGRTRNHRSSSTSSVAIISWPPMPVKPTSNSFPPPNPKRIDIRLMASKALMND